MKNHLSITFYVRHPFYNLGRNYEFLIDRNVIGINKIISELKPFGINFINLNRSFIALPYASFHHSYVLDLDYKLIDQKDINEVLKRIEEVVNKYSMKTVSSDEDDEVIYVLDKDDEMYMAKSPYSQVVLKLKVHGETKLSKYRLKHTHLLKCHTLTRLSEIMDLDRVDKYSLDGEFIDSIYKQMSNDVNYEENNHACTIVDCDNGDKRVIFQVRQPISDEVISRLLSYRMDFTIDTVMEGTNFKAIKINKHPVLKHDLSMTVLKKVFNVSEKNRVKSLITMHSKSNVVEEIPA